MVPGEGHQAAGQWRLQHRIGSFRGGRPTTGRYHVPAVGRAIDVLEVIAANGQPVRLKDLATELDIPRASLFSILATLVDIGALEKQGTEYVLGPRMGRLVGDMALAPRLARVAYPVLTKLVARLDQSAQVAVLHDGAAEFVAAVESTKTLRVATWVGNRNSLDSTAIGRALIFDRNHEELRHLCPDKSPEAIARLAAVLLHARRDGVTVDDGVTEPGVLCVGAPVRDGSGTVIAALSVSAPKASVTTRAREPLDEAVRQAAGEISASFGWEPVP